LHEIICLFIDPFLYYYQIEMKTSKLLLRLQHDIEPYKSKVKSNPNCLDVNNKSVQCAVSRYNLQNFHEILDLSPDEVSGDVDVEKLHDLENRVEGYFELHGPVDEEFKEFIKLICIYLTFMAHKPLHPPGIEFGDGTTVYQEGDNYYCTAKKLHIDEEYGLCRCCVACVKEVI
jgi:uncharacterized protein (UPF0305 family)